MTKSREGLRASVSQPKGRRRKKQTSRVERAFEGVRRLVSDTGDRLLSGSDQPKAEPKRASPKKSAADRKRSGQQRQVVTKKVGATRIRSARQRQAAAKKAVRSRRTKTS